MSSDKPYRIERDKKLITIETYLISRKVKPQHFSAMTAHVKGRKMGTREAWDKLFENYF